MDILKMTDNIVELRIQIDKLAQLTDTLTPYEDGDDPFFDRFFGKQLTSQIKESKESLLLGKAWLGKLLSMLSKPNPYKSGYKTVDDIQPTADVAEDPTTNIDIDWKEINHIERVDWLREEISNYIDQFEEYKIEFQHEYGSLNPSFYKKVDTIANLVYKYLSEARFWLGFELQRIKEEG